MRHPWTALLLCPALACAAAGDSPWQPSGAFVQAGGAEDTRAVALGLSWDWHWSRPLGAGRLTGYHELILGRWRSDVAQGHHDVTQLGYTPALRWWAGGGSRGFFLEGGIGANVLSSRYRTVDQHAGSNFLFGDHLGLGWRLDGGTEWSLRVQHFSNARLASPNPAIDFVQLRVALPLQGW